MATRRPTPRDAAHVARARVALRGRGLQVGRLPRLAGRLVVRNQGAIVIGDRLFVRGFQLPVSIGTGPDGTLHLGDRVFLNHGATLFAAARVTIGDDVQIGDLAAVYDTDFHQLEEGAEVRVAPVVIGDNVWIGRGAIVLPGVTIGDHAVVAAGAVVSGPVEARTLVAGVPARPVRTLTAADHWVRT